MKYLNLDEEDLKKLGGIHTAREISGQPDVWMCTFRKLMEEGKQLLEFIKLALSHDHVDVILTGAGTSAFIGEVLVGPYQKKWQVSCRAIGITSILTHPEHYFFESRSTLLISFARSGDSPESVAAVELAEKYCKDLYKLNITCNREGKLAKIKDDRTYTFLLPEETNDQSLAMTGSFSSMLLAGLMLPLLEDSEQMNQIAGKMEVYGRYLLANQLTQLKKIADLSFQRMVFLGSGPLWGVAHESHLKVQELSDGKIICQFDTFLGFRHGPRAVVNSETVIVYLFSNNIHSRQYEFDLVRSVSETTSGEKTVAVGNTGHEPFGFDTVIPFPGEISNIPEEFLSVFYILPAQIIGFYKSLNLGLSPDSPSKRGSITRVVRGVKIY